MLISGAELEVGEIASFEIAGLECRPAGLAEVAHSTNGGTGLRFVYWEASAERNIRDLIAARAGDSPFEPAALAIPGCYLG
jgi:hypothetical protein